MKILAISGSVRKDSLNTQLLRAAGEFVDEGTSIELFDLADIPFYNGDLDGDTKPASVQALLDAITAADGMLLATPEYNYSVSGVLKNAIDWASPRILRWPPRILPLMRMAAWLMRAPATFCRST